MSDDSVIDVETVEEIRQLPAVRAHDAVIARGEITVEELVAQAAKIRHVMETAMVPNVHYGVIPGTQGKPTLLKPGAEMLDVLFRLAPSYHSERVFHDGDHLTVVSRCTLTHIPTGMVIADGEGLCSTRETKYRWRQAGRVCPECGAETIIKGREEYGGGWICFKKKGGCGAKFADGTEQANAFETTETGRVENPDLADIWNTVLKMADKRALVAAVLNGTAASDVFTQDMEDHQPVERAERPADAQKAFDPATDLLPGAISGKDAPKRLGDALTAIDATVSWADVIAQAVEAVWGPDHSDWRSLTAAQQKTFWRRLSNSVEWITQAAGGDFVSDEQIVAGFAFGFGGVVVALTRNSPEPQTDDDIPFGEAP